jgi:hypothetical protein
MPPEIWAGQLPLVINSLGPEVLPNRQIEAVYQSFPVNDLPAFLEHVPLHQRKYTCFMHDGAPPQVLCTDLHLTVDRTVGTKSTGLYDPLGSPEDFGVFSAGYCSNENRMPIRRFK